MLNSQQLLWDRASCELTRFIANPDYSSNIPMELISQSTCKNKYIHSGDMWNKNLDVACAVKLGNPSSTWVWDRTGSLDSGTHPVSFQSWRNHVLESWMSSGQSPWHHLWRAMERLLLHHLRSPHTIDPLQFMYQEKLEVEKVVDCMLNQSFSHLDRDSGAVGIKFLTSPAPSTPSSPCFSETNW